MKTTLEKAPGKTKYGKKDLTFKLMNAEDRSLLGLASINLANYSKCLERKLFSVELEKSQFPEALIDFYITAAPVVGPGRAASIRATNFSGGDLATSSQIVQSTRNKSSFSFNDSRLEQAKKE